MSSFLFLFITLSPFHETIPRKVAVKICLPIEGPHSLSTPVPMHGRLMCVEFFVCDWTKNDTGQKKSYKTIIHILVQGQCIGSSLNDCILKSAHVGVIPELLN